MTPEDIATALTRIYWGRPANAAEQRAMADEMQRDSTAIAPCAHGTSGALFTVEPAHFTRLLMERAE
ncbi:hypothetical protein NAC44_16300 [Allorhizobium sp. BGMRC 0089]|uniref:hypothetical protein n=1 Tax=Allorhizobium sonneratiae TaxID=2934936 RepID=UPI002033A259|nr:hypothetical protein [Allorhizobium sonneratiae]MCM2293889.1 hypothetical protein [Allorhizobium sonneratiae]